MLARRSCYGARRWSDIDLTRGVSWCVSTTHMTDVTDVTDMTHTHTECDKGSEEAASWGMAGEGVVGHDRGWRPRRERSAWASAATNGTLSPHSTSNAKTISLLRPARPHPISVKGMCSKEHVHQRGVSTRPNQSFIFLLLNISQKNILRIVEYKYLKSCSEDFILQDPILRTRLCGAAFISQHDRVVDFRLINIIRRKFFEPVRY